MAGNEENDLSQSPSAPITGWHAFLKEQSNELKSSGKRCSSQNSFTAFIRKSKRQWSRLSKNEKLHYSTLDTKKSRENCRKRLLKDLNAEIDSTVSTSTYVVITSKSILKIIAFNIFILKLE